MVGVVTDGSCDIPPETIRQLNICVVPLYVKVGDRSYLDGIDIGPDQFYQHLSHGGRSFQTSAPSPGDFLKAYRKLAQDTDEIISIHLSSAYSATCDAASVAKGYLQGGCRIEVIDSGLVSVALGLIVVAAAEAAREGQGLDQITRLVRQLICRTRLFGAVEDFSYLLHKKRLRLTRGLILLGKVASLLRARLLGEVYDGGRIRSPMVVFGQYWALSWLRSQARRFPGVTRMAIAYSTARGEAEKLAHSLRPQFPEGGLFISRLSGVLGTYVGPGALVLAFIQGEER